MDIIVFILIIGAVVLFVRFVNTDTTECPPPQIVYRNLSARPIDIQFSEENFPSRIYSDMFDTSSPGFGGFKVGLGRTKVE